MGIYCANHGLVASDALNGMDDLVSTGTGLEHSLHRIGNGVCATAAETRRLGGSR